MTADTIGVSTGPLMRRRAPVANTTSMTPGGIGAVVSGAGSGGTSRVKEAYCGAP